MNKKILSSLIASSAAMSGVAHAQANVTLYGTLDVGVYYSAHQYNQDPISGGPAAPLAGASFKFASEHVVGLTSNGLSPSNIGFKGIEDLGNDLSAIFVAEMRFNANNGTLQNSIGSLMDVGASKTATDGGDGSTGGQLFSGPVNVGLKSKTYGTLTFGRILAPGVYALAAVDPMQMSSYFSPFGYTGQFAGDGFTEDAKIDNTIVYSNKFGGFDFSAMVKLGGRTGATSAGSAEGVTLGYINGPLTIEAAYQSFDDAISAGNAGLATPQYTLTYANTRGGLLGAAYTFDKFKLSGGYEYHVISAPSNPGADYLANYLGYPVASVNTTAYVGNERKQGTWWFGGSYYLGNLSLTAAVYSAHQNDWSKGVCTASGPRASAACPGNLEFASFLADYSLSKKTDVYLGYGFNNNTGGFDVLGTVSKTNNFAELGLRMKF